MAVRKGSNGGTHPCLFVAVSVFISWAVAIHCVATALPHETRSSYFVRSSNQANSLAAGAGGSSALEFSCAALCSVTKGCEKAVVISEEDGTQFHESCALAEKKLNNFRGWTARSIELQKLGVFRFGEGKFDLAEKCQNEKPLLRSCRNIHEENRSATDGMYNIALNDGTRAAVYCVMSDIPGCGGGGWTLVMKINGSQSFKYQSSLWSNKLTHNAAAASGGLDSQDALKSAAYWGVPVMTGLCLGMRVNNQLGKYVHLPCTASSLHSEIADNQYRSTSLGSDTWKSLINGSYLHGSHGQVEGFNANAGQPFCARIGITSKAPSNGNGVSILGFGISQELSCGNFALVKHGGTSQIKLIAFGTILVQ